jgi:hypothetical protein
MTTARIFLPADCTKGSIKYRKPQDRSRGVDVVVPPDVKVEFVIPSPSGTKGEAIVTDLGTKFTLEQ